jgi:hypothetical protein
VVFTAADHGLEVNDGEASLAEAATVLGVVASGFFDAHPAVSGDDCVIMGSI